LERPESVPAKRARDALARLDAQVKVASVLMEVRHHLVAREIPRRPVGHAIAWQTRELLDRVQVKAVVEGAPSRRDVVARLEDDARDSSPFQTCGGREAGGARANDDYWDDLPLLAHHHLQTARCNGLSAYWRHCSALRRWRAQGT